MITLREFTIQKLSEGFNQPMKIATLFFPNADSTEISELANEVKRIIDVEGELENE